MYLFNRITVNPQLPKRIEKLSEIANNLWWSWNTEFLRLFKKIDGDLWEQSNKNPVKFLKHVSQERLEDVAKDISFLKEYDKLSQDFENYMNSKIRGFQKISRRKKWLNCIFLSRIRTRPNYSDLFWWAWNIIRRPPKICKWFRNSASSSWATL